MGLQDLKQKLQSGEASVPFGFIKTETVEKKSLTLVPIKSGRGFAAMKPEDKKRVQHMGAIASHKGPKHLRCHEFNSEQARNAALKRWGKA